MSQSGSTERNVMGLFRKKRDDTRKYKTEEIGPVIIEHVQIPQSYHTGDDVYKAMSHAVRLRVKDGPIFFERSFLEGDDKDIAFLSKRGIFGNRRRIEFHSEMYWHFYSDLLKEFSK